MASAQDIREFKGFLRQASDRQVQGIYDKESRAGRDEYAELTVEEAERRGIDLERHGHARKKSSAQLDREITQALSKPGGRVHAAKSTSNGSMTIGNGQYRVLVAKDPHRGGYSAKLISSGIGTIMEPNGTSAAKALSRLVKELTQSGGDDRKLAKEIVAKSGGISHATAKRAVPGISKWDTFAGGTSAAPGKYSYSISVPEGKYYISPFTRGGGRHAGYYLKFATNGNGRPRGAHSGLWHELGIQRSPANAANAAAKHYAKGFE
jgi:hypothetical protein